MTKKGLLAGITTLAFSLLASFAADATPLTSLGIQFGSGAITTAATDSGTGVLSYSGVYTPGGGAIAITASAQSAPFQPQGTLLTNTIDTSLGAAGILKIYLTTTGLTSPQGVSSFLSTFTSNAVSGSISSIVEQTLISSTNQLYAGTELANKTFTGLGTSTSVNASPLLSGLYSETVVYTITATGAGNVNATVNMAAVPEPASLALVGASLLGIGMVRRKRTK